MPDFVVEKSVPNSNIVGELVRGRFCSCELRFSTIRDSTSVLN